MVNSNRLNYYVSLEPGEIYIDGAMGKESSTCAVFAFLEIIREGT